MFKRIAIAAGLLSMGLANAASANPVDLTCYMIDTAGQVINLDSMCGGAAGTAPSSAALLNTATAATEDEAASYLRFHKDGEVAGVDYEVWQSPEIYGGFYYFLWGTGQRNDAPNSPEVVAYFDNGSNVFVKPDQIAACYGRSDGCEGAIISNRGPCTFPWQRASDGSRCGARAAVIRPGGAY